MQLLVNLAHAAVKTGPAQEHGGAAALTRARETTKATFATVGAHGQWRLAGDAAMV